MFAKHGAVMDFTALEMQDSEQPAHCDCGPYELVDQAKQAAGSSGIGAWAATLGYGAGTCAHTASLAR